MAETNVKMNSNLHIAMFPWLAFGHFLPFLHLSNKLAKRGINISFLLPKGVVPKLAKLNRFPNQIRFFPLTIPHVDGLPFSAETLSDIPISLESQLCTAMDQTRDQVRAILGNVMPDFVLFDFSFWIPSLARELRIKSVMFYIVCGALIALGMENPQFNPLMEFGSGISFRERLRIGTNESDALAIRTCYEIEGTLVEKIAQICKKPVLLTGPVLPQQPEEPPLDNKWETWLNKFEPGSVVFCAFGSQTALQLDQFQELLLGLELCGMPFFAALARPSECLTMHEAMPDGFEARVKDRGVIHEGWVPQVGILSHRSIGCFVSHGGSGSMWESLASDCRIVLIPPKFDHAVHAKLMVEGLGVAVEAEKRENGWISKESLSDATKSAMSLDSELGSKMQSNHRRWREFLLDNEIQDSYIDNFIQNLRTLLL